MEITDDRFASVPRDLAKQLGYQGVRKLLTLLTDAYRDLYAKRCVCADSSEDSITEEWFVHIVKRWRPENTFGLIPIPQKEDTGRAKPRGRPPTIDFCFRDEFFPQSYFGVECKLLDQECATHLNNYLDNKEGIGRFLSGKYSAHTGTGSMVGYVRRGDCNVVAKAVAFGVKQLVSNTGFKKSHPLPDFEQLYESEHDRQIGVSPFLCYHLFFAFNC